MITAADISETHYEFKIKMYDPYASRLMGWAKGSFLPFGFLVVIIITIIGPISNCYYNINLHILWVLYVMI